MTANDFRQLALSQLNARVATRLGMIEFLIGDKVFATLGAPDPALATLRLTPQTKPPPSLRRQPRSRRRPVERGRGA